MGQAKLKRQRGRATPPAPVRFVNFLKARPIVPVIVVIGASALAYQGVAPRAPKSSASATQPAAAPKPKPKAKPKVARSPESAPATDAKPKLAPAPQKAAQAQVKAAAAPPAPDPAAVTQARQLSRQKKYADAQQLLEQADIGTDGMTVALRDFELAQLAFLQGRDQPAGSAQAVAHFDRAVAGFTELVPKVEGKDTLLAARARSQIAASHLFAQRNDAAFAAYQALAGSIQDEKYRPKALLRSGLLAPTVGEKARGEAALRELLKAYPSHRLARKARTALGRLQKLDAPAPALAVESWLGDASGDLDSRRGKVVLLFFWATWCPHCKKALPDMSALHRRFAGRGLEVIGVTNNGKGQTTETVKKFVAGRSIAFAQAIDDGGKTAGRYDANAVPVAALIDRKGQLRFLEHPNWLSPGTVEQLLGESG